VFGTSEENVADKLSVVELNTVFANPETLERSTVYVVPAGFPPFAQATVMEVTPTIVQVDASVTGTAAAVGEETAGLQTLGMEDFTERTRAKYVVFVLRLAMVAVSAAVLELKIVPVKPEAVLY